METTVGRHHSKRSKKEIDKESTNESRRRVQAELLIQEAERCEACRLLMMLYIYIKSYAATNSLRNVVIARQMALHGARDDYRRKMH